MNAEGFVDLMKKQDDLSQLTVIGSSTVVSHYLAKLEQKFIKGMHLNKSIFT